MFATLLWEKMQTGDPLMLTNVKWEKSVTYKITERADMGVMIVVDGGNFLKVTSFSQQLLRKGSSWTEFTQLLLKPS